MKRRDACVSRFIGATPLFALLLGSNAFAQPKRIVQPVNNSDRFKMTGQLHPLARGEYDKGPADPSMKLSRLTLVLKKSEQQSAELNRLLVDLQDPKSPNYHRWLTPEVYADRFGLNPADLSQIAHWLESQGLKVTSVARARNAITVTGTVGRIENAFHTEIRKYVIAGEAHYANATEPSLPRAFESSVLAIHGLHNFRLQAHHVMAPKRLSARAGTRPQYTDASSGGHYLAPDDYATIFDINALYSSGIDGSSQTIVIVGQTDIDPSHLNTFRETFGMSDPSLKTILIPDSDDPGYSETDAQESDLDLEWASSIARRASLLFVYGTDVTDAVQYAIDQNLAPVISMSYGECETSSTQGDALTMQSWAQQGNAQGITWLASSGDSGAASCYPYYSGPFGYSTEDMTASVNVPASIPEVTAVGGTEFSEGSGNYWSSSNTSNYASALSYIPETSWNDSSTNHPAASGGGASQFFTKPSWQTGTSVPSDGARDVPDLAFPASADHDGYLVFTTSGRETGWYIFGGTSAGTPAFAGVATLLNHYLVTNGYQSTAGLGNINPQLYGLAAASSSMFHDVNSGNNTVTAVVCGDLLCVSRKKESVGYSSAAAYDQVTGWGSLDVWLFVTGWQNYINSASSPLAQVEKENRK
jgi:subtilase family serine protease